jgi:hypothetical protein
LISLAAREAVLVGDIGDDDRRPLAAERLGGRTSHTAGSPGDQGNLVG